MKLLVFEKGESGIISQLAAAETALQLLDEGRPQLRV